MIGNEIAQISPKISQLVHLEVLDLSGNQIESIPKEIGALTQLRELHVLNNKISDLPEDIRKLNGTLHVLALSGNIFESVPRVVLELTQVRLSTLINPRLLTDIPATHSVDELQSTEAHPTRAWYASASPAQVGVRVQSCGRSERHSRTASSLGGTHRALQSPAHPARRTVALHCAAPLRY